MNFLRVLILSGVIVAGCGLTGCTSSLAKLPPISGDSITYDRTDPLGGTHITAKGVTARPDGTLNAEEVEWTTTYPQFTFHVKVTGYRQGPEAAPAKAP